MGISTNECSPCCNTPVDPSECPVTGVQYTYDLLDVEVSGSAPNLGQVLTWDGTNWTNADSAGGGNIAPTAAEVSYDNTTSGSVGDNVQEALDELFEGGGGTPAPTSNYVDIRDYGAVADDPSVDNAPAILAAIADADPDTTVLLYGGKYYVNNFNISTTCRLSGGGTLAPVSAVDLDKYLLTINASKCQITNLTTDFEEKGMGGILVTGDDNIFYALNGQNILATSAATQSCTFLRISGGSRNVAKNIHGVSIKNDGTTASEGIGRLVSIDNAASTNNLLFDITGNNVNLGVNFSEGSGNSLTGFAFANDITFGPMFAAVQFSYQATGCIAQSGTVTHCENPVILRGTNNTAKGIATNNSGSLRLDTPASDLVVDSINQFTSDDSTLVAPLISTKDEDSGEVSGLTIQNCITSIPMVNHGFLDLADVPVEGLKVLNNNVTLRITDSTAANVDRFVDHLNGDGTQYNNNKFVVSDTTTGGIPSERIYTIRIPSDNSQGYWINNILASSNPLAKVRVIGAFNSGLFDVEDDNLMIHEGGQIYIESGLKPRNISGTDVPSAGAWRNGDTITNSDLDLAPAAGFDYKKYQTFVCTKSGDFSDVNPANHPEFTLVTDMSGTVPIDTVTTPTLTSPVNGTQLSGSTAALVSSAFAATGALTHVSTDWEVATDAGFTNIVFSSLADATNKTSISATGLPNPDTVFIRVAYIGSGDIRSNWSATVSVDMNAAPIVDDQVGAAGTFTDLTVTTTSLGDVYSSADKSISLASGTAGKLFKSTDTTNWTAVSHPGAGGTTTSIPSVDGSDDGSRLFFGQGPTNHTNAKLSYYSTNGGASWVAMTGINSYITTNIDAITHVACDATGNTLLTVTGEVYSSAPGASLNRAFISHDGGVTVSHMAQIGSGPGHIEGCHVVKDDSSVMYVCTRGKSSVNGRILRSVNNGVTWVQPTTPPTTANDEVIFEVCASGDGQYVYCSAQNGRMFRSIDFGQTWAEINIGMVTDSVRSCHVSRDGKLVTFGTQVGDYIRSYDFGATFSLTQGFGATKLLACNTNSTGDLMYVSGHNGHVYKSTL